MSTNPIIVTVTADAGRTCVIEVDPNERICDSVMVLVEVELGIPTHHQRLFVDGRPLDPNKSLAAQGCHGTTCSIVLRQFSSSSPQDASRLIEQLFSTPPPQPLPATVTQGASGGAPMVPAPQDAAEIVARLFAAGGGGGAAALAPPPAFLDENDPEVQRKLLQAIEQQNIMQNMEQAIEHTPEAFARVVMLYVPATVNNVPVTAFIDSGAQMTIMNEATAERCGILRLLDRRMQGVAKGVGTSKILGRIHMALVNIGGVMLPMSITVLESQDMEFLVGLDQLRRHQMIIDLERNCLRINSAEKPIAVQFLGEGELPARLRGEPEGDVAEGAAARAPAQSTAPSAPTSGHVLTSQQNEKILRVQELSGADRASVIAALEASDWNEDTAVGFLFE